jgi:GTP cyclohydrolase III
MRTFQYFYLKEKKNSKDSVNILVNSGQEPIEVKHCPSIHLQSRLQAQQEGRKTYNDAKKHLHTEVPLPNA